MLANHRTTGRQIIRKGVCATAGAVLCALVFVTEVTPLAAQDCSTVCEFTYSCLVLGNQAPGREKELKKLQRGKRKFVKNCQDGCKKNQAAAVACYKKSGGQNTTQACVSAANCLKPYMQK